VSQKQTHRRRKRCPSAALSKNKNHRRRKRGPSGVMAWGPKGGEKGVPLLL